MFSRLVVRSFLLGVLIIASTVAVNAQAPTPGGDCCSIHAGPSCDIAACAACVCEDLDEPLCCSTGGDDGWDQICVALASSDDCAADCGCGAVPTPTPTPGGDCCTTHDGGSCDDSTCSDCVCGVDDLCCQGPWDATCVAIARDVDECSGSCTSCTPLPTEPPDATPTPGPCCEGRDLNPGCDESTCEACVCGVDGVCCTDTWDDSCVVIAAEECALECICEQDGNCCQGHDGLGCNDRDCQECVLALDAACGDLGWDDDCAGQAAVECALECPCGDCCAEQDVAGCGDKTCQDCVCAADEACCDPEQTWDSQCESVAREECSLECPCNDCCQAQEEGSEIVGCGEKPCQECVCALDANCCFEEWDGICAARASDECERRCSCEPVSNCCVGRDEPGCEIPSCEACVCDLDSFCCDDFWDGGCAEELALSAECAAVCQCTGAGGDCVGDCNGDGEVAINELVLGVRINLGEVGASACPAFDGNADGQVSVAELIQAVNAALNGCPA